MVPKTMRTRWVVMMRSGGRVRRTHIGVTASKRMNMEVSAGRVVAEVAVDWVLRNSVRRRKGSSKTSQRFVKTWRVFNISSRLFLCCDSEAARLRFLCSPFHDVLDSGLYLREYIPAINTATNTTGPAHRRISSPYSTVNQNTATKRKLSHGSPVVHDSSPARWFSGRMKGCEYANARVTWGGVAVRSGDFW
jgi:hypothetical protein